MAPFSLPLTATSIGIAWLYIDVAADDRAKAIIIAVRESRLQGSWFARTSRVDPGSARRDVATRFVQRHRCIQASRMLDRLCDPPTYTYRRKLCTKAPTYTVICTSISMFMYRYILTCLEVDSPRAYRVSPRRRRYFRFSFPVAINLPVV